jgi:hypothetical protein
MAGPGAALMPAPWRPILWAAFPSSLRTRLDGTAAGAQTRRMALVPKPLVRRAVALRALAGGRSPSWLRPQLRALRRIVFAKPSRPR